MYPYYIILFVAIILFGAGLACSIDAGKSLYSTTEGKVSAIGNEGTRYYLDYAYTINNKLFRKRANLYLGQYHLLKNQFGKDQKAPIVILYSKLLPGISKPLFEDLSNENRSFCSVLMYVGLIISVAIGSSIIFYN